jgi:hypothetical protein
MSLDSSVPLTVMVRGNSRSSQNGSARELNYRLPVSTTLPSDFVGLRVVRRCL